MPGSHEERENTIGIRNDTVIHGGEGTVTGAWHSWTMMCQ